VLCASVACSSTQLSRLVLTPTTVGSLSCRASCCTVTRMLGGTQGTGQQRRRDAYAPLVQKCRRTGDSGATVSIGTHATIRAGTTLLAVSQRAACTPYMQPGRADQRGAHHFHSAARQRVAAREHHGCSIAGAICLERLKRDRAPQQARLPLKPHPETKRKADGVSACGRVNEWSRCSWDLPLGKHACEQEPHDRTRTPSADQSQTWRIQ